MMNRNGEMTIILRLGIMDSQFSAFPEVGFWGNVTQVITNSAIIKRKCKASLNSPRVASKAN
jgi:hypothetical protein